MYTPYLFTPGTPSTYYLLPVRRWIDLAPGWSLMISLLPDEVPFPPTRSTPNSWPSDMTAKFQPPSWCVHIFPSGRCRSLSLSPFPQTPGSILESWVLNVVTCDSHFGMYTCTWTIVENNAYELLWFHSESTESNRLLLLLSIPVAPSAGQFQSINHQIHGLGNLRQKGDICSSVSDSHVDWSESES